MFFKRKLRAYIESVVITTLQAMSVGAVVMMTAKADKSVKKARANVIKKENKKNKSVKTKTITKTKTKR